MQSLPPAPQNHRVGRKPNQAGGTYAKAAKLLADAVDARMSRKEFAGKIEESQRSVSNWMRGETWPRDVAIRDKMRRVLGHQVVDELENAVAEVLGLPHYSAEERAVLQAMRSPATRKAIEDAITKAEKKR